MRYFLKKKKKMGDPHTKTIRLNERLIASFKVSYNKQNVPISKTGPSVVIADNATNEPLSSQHSDNDCNNKKIKTIDINIPNRDSINKTNHIQSVHNINSSSQQNTNNEPEKYASGKKIFRRNHSQRYTTQKRTRKSSIQSKTYLRLNT